LESRRRDENCNRANFVVSRFQADGAYDARDRGPKGKFQVKYGSADFYGELMRKPWIRALVGIIAFALPALMSVIGMQLDRSSIRHDPMYERLVPIVLCSSVLLAAVVPGVLIMASRLSLRRRIGLTVATLCLLALECVIAGYIVLMEGMR
jgi:uncharacterized membrane protein YidH (DUF202 family)